MLGMRPPTTPGAVQTDDGAAGAVTTFAAPALGGTAHEGAGTETVVTAPGSRAEAPTLLFSDLGNYTATPNGQHASTLSPSGAATISGLAPDNVAAGAGTSALTVTGTNFTKESQVYVNGVKQTTVFVSKTSLTVAAAPKKVTAGTVPVTVQTGGVTTAASNWTFV
jgi:hypothetical protein